MAKWMYGVAGGLLLTACGGSDSPDIDAPELPPASDAVETETVEAESAPSPGYGPPPEEYAHDGDVITGKVGEEFSFKLDVPDGTSTAVNWNIADGAYEPIATYDKTWRALEGSTRYSEIVLMGAEAGETTVTFHLVDTGVPVEGHPTKTLTFKVTD